MIHGHGDDAYRYPTRRVTVNFSTNIPNRRHPGLEQHLAESMSLIGSYPEPGADTLTRRLAADSGVETGNILVTNGAVDAIYSLAQLYRGSRSTVVAPTFSEYGDAATIYDHTLTYVDSLDDITSATTDLVWLCNPNNPTGTFIDAESVLDAVDAHPATLFVVDQAYEDYVTACCIADSEAAKRDNLVVVHSMTKRYQMPGLRIGYLAASASIIARLSRYRMPWGVNSLAIEAALYALDHPAEFVIDTPSLVAEQLRVAGQLRSIGVDVMPSATNFLLGTLSNGASAADLKRRLIDDHGMLIRDASNFYGLTRSHFRIAVQSRNDNNLLIEAIAQWLQQYCHT